MSGKELSIGDRVTIYRYGYTSNGIIIDKLSRGRTLVCFDDCYYPEGVAYRPEKIIVQNRYIYCKEA